MKVKSIFLLVIMLSVSLFMASCGSEPTRPTEYTVKYYMTDAGRWEGTTSEQIEEGQTTPELTIIELSDGRTFNFFEDFKYIYKDVEWFSDENHTLPFDFDQEITAHITIYGNLIEKDSYEMKYYVDDTLYTTETFLNGEDVTMPIDPPEANGKRVAWYWDAGFERQFLGFNDPAIRDHTLYAYIY